MLDKQSAATGRAAPGQQSAGRPLAGRMKPRVAFAGIVPYGVDHAGRPHLLLAREQYGAEAGRWSCFAGRPETTDADGVLATAAREGHEESSGLLGTREDLEKLLSVHGTRVDAPHGVHYVFPIQYSAYLPRMFQGVQAAIRAARGSGADPYHATLEKNALQWVELGALQSAQLQLRRGFAADLPELQRCIAALVSGPRAT